LRFVKTVTPVLSSSCKCHLRTSLPVKQQTAVQLDTAEALMPITS
jgi:hypothetical protein